MGKGPGFYSEIGKKTKGSFYWKSCVHEVSRSTYICDVLFRLACGPGLHLWLQSERGKCRLTVSLLARHESLFILGFILFERQIISKNFWAGAQRAVKIAHNDLVYVILNIGEWYVLIILELCEVGLRFIQPYSSFVHRSSFQGLHIWPEVYDHHQYPIWIGEVLTPPLGWI